MAWRPAHLVQAGELDNTQLGWTTGWLELDGFEHRLELKLAGNCHPDLAGWKFRNEMGFFMTQIGDALESNEAEDEDL